MSKQVLLLGGTGAMGNHLVAILSNGNYGYDVSVTSRSQHKQKAGVSYIQGNAHDDKFLDTVLGMKKWNVIVDFMIYNSAEFSNRVERLLSSCSQYVFLSSSRVYADSKTPITEDSPRLLDVCKDEMYLLTDEYALSKAREEDVLKNSSLKNWTIIRPYITYSEERLQLGVSEKEGWLYRALHGRTIVFSNDIASKITTLTYGLDVAKGIVALLGNTSALGKTFHITANSKTWNDILEIYLSTIERKTGHRPHVLYLDKNERLTSRIPSIGIWQVLVDRLYNRKFDNSNIAKYIDVDEFLQVEDGLAKSLEYFIDHVRFKPINWRSEAYYDKLTHEHASIFEMETLKQKIKYVIYRYIIPTRFF